ncbi:MAG: protein translocase subunit SecF [Acidimicrobiia bacterium]|nr:protein translocase subunit SecF [Acidimicrobiia bacterium]
MSVFTRMYRGETDFDFVGASSKTLIVSAVLVVLSILLMIVRPFNLSIDFTGGVIVVAPNESQATVEVVRADLRGVGYADARVQITGEGDDQFVQVQTEALDPAEQDRLVAAVAEASGADADDINVSAVGPTFGAEVTRRAIQALVVFLVVVSLFIAWRFEWKMALAALAALFHDLIIAGGIYAAIGFEVTPSTIIAVLTILGYSLYDTVVVFDKVTENVNYADNKTTYTSIINRSMNQVLMRSVNTSLTSLLPVGSLLLVGFLAIGAETLREFALALFIGIALGTYSSLFVAAPLLARWKETEPEWERRRRRAARAESDDDEPAVVEAPPADGGTAPAAAPRPPKQRRKRR